MRFSCNGVSMAQSLVKGWHELVSSLRNNLKPEFLGAEGRNLERLLQRSSVPSDLTKKFLPERSDFAVCAQTLALAVRYPRILCQHPWNLTQGEAETLLNAIKHEDAEIGEFAETCNNQSLTSRFIQNFGTYTGVQLGEGVTGRGFLGRFRIDSANMTSIHDSGVFSCQYEVSVLVQQGVAITAEMKVKPAKFTMLGFVGESMKGFVAFDYLAQKGIVFETYALAFGSDLKRLVGMSSENGWRGAFGKDYKHIQDLVKHDFRIMQRVDLLDTGLANEALIEMFTVMQKTDFCEDQECRQVTVKMSVDIIKDISHVDESFFVSFSVTLEWPLSVADWVSKMSDPSTWKPDWLPPDIIVPNATELQHRAETKTVGNQGQRMQCVITAEARISEEFELYNFPFDCQDLKVAVSFASDSRMQIAPATNALHVHNSLSAGCGWTLENVIFEHVSSQAVKVRLKIKRNWVPYARTVFLVLGLICLQAVVAFIFPVPEELEARMNVHTTLFLAAVAYQIVVSSDLPKLPYATILDRYTIFVYVMLVVVLFLDAGTHLVARSSDDEELIGAEWDKVIFIIVASGIGATHLVFAIYCFCVIIPKENRKLALASDSMQQIENTGGRTSLLASALQYGQSRQSFLAPVGKKDQE